MKKHSKRFIVDDLLWNYTLVMPVWIASFSHVNQTSWLMTSNLCLSFSLFPSREVLSVAVILVYEIVEHIRGCKCFRKSGECSACISFSFFLHDCIFIKKKCQRFSFVIFCVENRLRFVSIIEGHYNGGRDGTLNTRTIKFFCDDYHSKSLFYWTIWRPRHSWGSNPIPRSLKGCSLTTPPRGPQILSYSISKPKS